MAGSAAPGALGCTFSCVPALFISISTVKGFLRRCVSSETSFTTLTHSYQLFVFFKQTLRMYFRVCALKLQPSEIVSHSQGNLDFPLQVYTPFKEVMPHFCFAHFSPTTTRLFKSSVNQNSVDCSFSLSLRDYPQV